MASQSQKKKKAAKKSGKTIKRKLKDSVSVSGGGSAGSGAPGIRTSTAYLHKDIHNFKSSLEEIGEYDHVVPYRDPQQKKQGKKNKNRGNNQDQDED